MPTYAYACTACDHRFDAQQSFSDPALTQCPECAGRLRKLFSSVGVVFKGSGFYRTDSRSGSASVPSGGSASSGGSSGSPSGGGESSGGSSSTTASGAGAASGSSGSASGSSSGGASSGGSSSGSAATA